MPIHDWTRVETAVCQTFHLAWCTRLKAWLNHELLSPEYYALLEPSAREPTDGFTGPTIGERLRCADEMIPTTLGDDAAGVWETVGWNAVVIRSADRDEVIHTIRLPLRPELPLADMPVFLRPGMHVSLPLEETYMRAYEEVPPRWRRVIDGV